LPALLTSIPAYKCWALISRNTRSSKGLRLCVVFFFLRRARFILEGGEALVPPSPRKKKIDPTTALLCSQRQTIHSIKPIYFWHYFVILNLQEYFLIYLLPVIWIRNEKNIKQYLVVLFL